MQMREKRGVNSFPEIVLLISAARHARVFKRKITGTLLTCLGQENRPVTVDIGSRAI